MNPQNLFLQPLLDVSVEKKLLRNEFLLYEGQIEHNLYFVKSGALRAFYISELEEMSIRFGYQGSIISSLTSFITKTPSQLYLQAIRSATIAVISKDKFDAFLTQNSANLLFYNQLLEKTLAEQIEREIDLLTQSPSERYKRVLARSPQLFQEIPLKYIASYLRMTPETLSRLRKS